MGGGYGEMRSRGWGPMMESVSSYGEEGTRALSLPHVGAQGEGGRLQAGKGLSPGHWYADTFILDSQPPELG